MTKVKKGIVWLLLVAALLSICSIGVSAANACSYVSGSARSTKTFSATTSNFWILNGKIVIKQQEGIGEKTSGKQYNA